MPVVLGRKTGDRFSRRHTAPAEAFWEEHFAALVKRLRVSRPVRLAVSATARVPSVVGWLKPVVLVPAAVFTGLASEQIEALLAHELAHVRRYDYVINMLQTVAETLLFYHPAIWWVGRCIRNERENCCDDLAVEICSDPTTYVRALTDLEQLRGTTSSFAIAADGGSLVRRVERLLDLNSHTNSTPSGLLAVIGIALVCISVIGVQARGLARPQRRKISSPAAQAATTKPEALVEPSPLLSPEVTAAVAQPRAEVTPAKPLLLDRAPEQNSGDWLAEIEAAGLKDLGVEKLIELKALGIDGKYIKETRGAGFDPSVDKLVELKVQGIKSEYINQMQATGLQLTLDKLVEFRVQRITPDFIKEQNRAWGTLSPDKLVELKVQGVTPQYAQEIRSLGFTDLTVDKLIETKVQGVTPDYIRAAKSRFKDLTLDQIIQLKIFNILK